MTNTLRWLLTVPKGKRRSIVVLMLLQVVNGGSGVLYALLLRQIVDHATARDSAGFWQYVVMTVLLVLGQISVVGITFQYTEEGVPVGLCKVSKLFFVTTAGGNYVPEEYGFGYIKALAQGFYQINDVRMIKAVGLDIDGADCEEILRTAEKTISKDTLH